MNNPLTGPIAENISEIEQGNFSLIWTNFSAEAECLEDGTELFTLFFEAVGDPGEISPFVFSENITDFEFYAELPNGESCEFTIDSGISIEQTNQFEIVCTDFYVSHDICNNGNGTSQLILDFCGGVWPISYNISAVNAANSVSDVFTGPDDVETIVLAAPEMYLMEFTDNAGNTFIIPDNFAFINTFDGPNLTVQAFVEEEPRCGTSSGDIGVTFSGGSGHPFEVAWSSLHFDFVDGDDQDTSFLESVVQGTYQVTVTDANGCTEEDEVILFKDPLVGMVVSTVDATCTGSRDGSVVITASGGTPFPGNEYEFEGNLLPEFILDELNPRDYEIRVTDMANCAVIVSFTINETNPPMDFDFTVLTPVPCVDGNAEIQVNTGSLDSSPNISVENADGEQVAGVGLDPAGNIIFEGPADTYSISYNNGDGCFVFGDVIITEPDPIAILDPLVNQDPSCEGGDGNAQITVSGGTGTPMVQWFLDGEEVATGINPTTLDQGEYTIFVTDENMCTAELESAITLTQSEAGLNGVIVEISSLDCDDGVLAEISYDIADPQDLIFQWTDIDGNILGTEQNLSGLGPGEYFVSVEDPNSACAPHEISYNLMAVGDILLENVTQNNATCGGILDGAISFDVTSTTPTNIVWDDPALSGSNLTNLGAGTYNLTVTDEDGCSLTESFEILNQTEIILIDFTENNPACFGEMDGSIIDLQPDGGNVAGDYNYAWNFDNQTTSDLVGVPAGAYSVSITDDNGCENIFEFLLEDPDEFVVNIDADNTMDIECMGNGLGEIALELVGGAGDFDYTWEPDVSNDDIARDLPEGDYAVTVTDVNGCSATASYLLSSAVGFTATITVESGVGCGDQIDDGALSVEVDPPAGDYTYVWMDDTGMQLSPAATATGLTAGNYTVIVSDQDGCSTSAVETIDGAAPFSIEAASVVQPLCNGIEDGNLSITLMDANSASYTYQWSHDVNLDSDTADNLSEGIYTVTVTDAEDCQNIYSETLIFQETIELLNSTVEDLKCADEANGSISVEPTGGLVATDYTYEWNGDVGTSNLTNLISDTFDLVVTDDQGCLSEFQFIIDAPDTLEVEINNVLTLNLGCSGTETGIIAIDAEGGTPSYSYVWTDNVSDDEIASGIGEGEYFVTVTDGNGCSEVLNYTLSSATTVTGSILPIAPIECNSGSTEICIDPTSLSGGNGDYFYSILNGEAIPADSCTSQFANDDLYVYIFDSDGCFQADSIPIPIPQPDAIQINLDDSKEINIGDSLSIISAEVIEGGAPIDSIFWISNGGTFDCIDIDACTEIEVNAARPTEYTIVVIDENGCRMEDRIFVSVVRQENVFVPDVFEPGDTENGQFNLVLGPGVEQLNFLTVFDRWGKIVYEISNPVRPGDEMVNGWNGTDNNTGTELVAGVYIYKAEVLFVDGIISQYAGNITLLR